MKSQVRAGEVLDRRLPSMPWYIGRVKNCEPVAAWQAVHWRVSVRASRIAVSVLRPAGRSTVTATALQPARSARATSFIATSRSEEV